MSSGGVYIKKFLQNYIWYILIFIILYFEFEQTKADWIYTNNYMMTYYCLSYSVGFAPRLLIGTIVVSLYDVVTYSDFCNFITKSMIVLFVLLAFIFGEMIRKSQSENKIAIVVIILLYCISPVSPWYRALQYNFGRLDLYQFILLSIAFIIMSRSEKYSPLILFSVIIVGTLIQETFLFLFFPAMVGMCLYKCVHPTYYSVKFWKYLTIMIITLTSLLFLIMNMIPAMNLDTMIRFAESHSTMPYDESVIYGVFGWTIDQELHLEAFRNLGIRTIKGLLTVVFTIPVWLPFTILYTRCIKNTDSIEEKKLFFILILLPLMALPLFLTAIDWGRWFAAIFVCDFFVLFYLIMMKNTTVISIITSISKIRGTIIVCILVGIYYLYLGPMDVAFQPIIEQIGGML